MWKFCRMLNGIPFLLQLFSGSSGSQCHGRDLIISASANLILVLILTQVHPTYGGSCYMNMDRNGYCLRKALVKTVITKEECCDEGAFFNGVSTSWSPIDLHTSASVFLMDIQGGVPCSRCKNSCQNVHCPENYKCAIRRGGPKCICAPACPTFQDQNGQPIKGPVCGSDMRTYKSTCRLLKRSCRQKISISIAYPGTCKTSCSKLNCTGKKRCLLDQNLIPHCVHCSHRCSGEVLIGPRRVCGVDGFTYSSLCKLRTEACLKGKAIPVAYKGPCKKKPTCKSIKCTKGQKCLMELGQSPKPRCVTCSRPCKGMRPFPESKPICATNRKSYDSWCDMTKDGCRNGVVLEALHLGECMKLGGAN